MLDDDRPFYRFASHQDAGEHSEETKVSAGYDDMNVLDASTKSRLRKANISELFSNRPHYANTIPIAEDNSFPVSELLDDTELSPEATGLAVLVKNERRRQFVSFALPANPSERDDALANLRVEVNPNLVDEDKESIEAYVREILPLPREHESQPIRIPANARLSFATAFEPILQLDSGTPIEFRIGLSGNEIDETVFQEVRKPPPGGRPMALQWSHHTIDLSRFAGKVVAFSFRADFAEPPTEQQTTSPVWGNPVLYAAKVEQPTTRPNVILISLDTLRADHLKCYGYHRDTSPNIDAFADESILFEQCIAPSSWTTPSHASLFTGWPPYLHEAGGHAGYRLESHFTTLAELARTNEYLTAAFTEGGAIAGPLGFYDGFDLYANGKPVTSKTPGTAAETFDRANKWLEQYGHLPHFLFVHTYEIHHPYETPAEDWNKFTKPGAEPPETGPPAIGIEHKDTLRDHYDNGISYTDHVFGEFMERMKSAGLLENTIVVLFSDHGEEFGEHDGMTHGISLYNESLHVPFIVRMPGGQNGGARVSRPIGLTDLFPTIVDLMGFDYEPPQIATNLTPFLREPSRTAASQQPFHNAHLYNISGFVALSTQHDGYKYIVANRFNDEDSPLSGFLRTESEWSFSPFEHALLNAAKEATQTTIHPAPGILERVPSGAIQEYLFDMQEDPGEQKNLAGDKSHREILDALRDDLSDRLRRVGEFADEDGLQGAETVTPMTEEQEERLRALGYIE